MAEPGGGPLDFNGAKTSLTIVDETRLQRLRDALQARSADLVRQIFPHATISPSEARVGDLDGNPGDSLSVALDKGVWLDHATGEHGDLIELWRATAHTTFPQAIDDLEHWAGLSHAKRPKFASPIVKLSEQRKSQPQPEANKALGAPVQTWHYHSADGVILGKVSKYVLANGEKTYRPFNAHGEMKPPDPRPLYRLPQIRTADTVIFVEGEKCADALASLGYEATSAMQGANTLIEKTDWSPLAGKNVILWPDNDPPGYAFMERVAPILESLGCMLAYVEPPNTKPNKWDAADAVEAGEEVSDYLPTFNQAKPPAQRFRILTIAELMEIEDPEWRIDGIFPTHGTSTIYGAFETFKSFIATDMMLALATGQAWHGRETKPTNVLYVAGEGQRGLALRVAGWLAANKITDHPAAFRALPEIVAIPRPGDADAFLKSIEATGLEFGVIVLDTVTRMSGGGSLNDEKDVQAYVQASDRIRTVTGAHVMHIGHSGKDSEKGLMGSVVLPAAMETIIATERRGNSVTLINSHPKGKQKDGAAFANIRFAMREFHFERRGKDTKTLIVTPDDEVVIEEAENNRPLGPLQARLFTEIKQAAAIGGAGFTRLKIAADANDGSISKALKKMEERGLIREIGEEGLRRWLPL